MPRNGSGQYNLPYDWNDDKANGIKVLASRMQTQDEDIGTALTGSVAADGQTPLTGDLDFNNNKAIDVADGSDLGDGINVSQDQTGETQFYGVSTTTPAGTNGEDYDIAAFATISVYPTYTRFSFICHFTCIVNPNLRIDTLATKTLKKSNGASGYTALVAGDMVADKEYIATYNEDINSTDIIIENPEKPVIDSTSITKATTSVYGVSYLPSQITIANNGSDPDNDINFGAGVFQFSDGSGQAVATAMTKRLDGTWVAGSGQGGLDTGSKANSTWYYMWAIYNPTSGVSDFLFSASLSSPTMPTGYTKKNYLAALRTNSSGNILGGLYVVISNGKYRFNYNSEITERAVTTNSSGITVTAPNNSFASCRMTAVVSGGSTTSNCTAKATDSYGNVAGAGQSANITLSQGSTTYLYNDGNISIAVAGDTIGNCILYCNGWSE